MTSDINKWPNYDSTGEFVFSDGYSYGFNLAFEFVNSQLYVRVLEVDRGKVINRSDRLELKTERICYLEANAETLLNW